MIESAIKDVDWYKGNPGVKRIATLIEGCQDYFEDLKAAQGKIVLSVPQSLKIDKIVESLSTHPRTAFLFDRSTLNNHPNVDVYYQLPIYFIYKGLKCKALLDMVFAFKDDEGKVVRVKPVDLKTMFGATTDFLSSLKQWGYHIQAAWYTEALKHFLNPVGLTQGEYILENFQFVVESSSKQGEPLLYTVSDDLLHLGKYGRPQLIVFGHARGEGSDFTYNIPHKEIRGFESLLDEYKYYMDTEWKQDKLISESNGVLLLDWDGVNI